MISFHSGNPGSGKSLDVAEKIYIALKKQKNVIANFDINMKLFPKIKKRKKLNVFINLENKHLTVDYLYKFSEGFHALDHKGQVIENQTLVVIDEAQLIFNSRTWNLPNRAEWCYFFTQHRKFGFDIIIVSQNDRLIDKQIRGVFEYEIKHKKVNNYKFFGKVLGFLCGGNLFVCKNVWYSNKEVVETRFFRGKRRYYDFYNSYKIFDTER